VFRGGACVADGRTVWLSDFVNVVTENGAPRVLRGFLKDITNRRNVEVELRKSYEKLTKAEQIARMGFLDWNLKTNQVVLSNGVYTLYGLTPGMPVNIEQIVALVHPDDYEFVNKNLVRNIHRISSRRPQTAIYLLSYYLIHQDSLP
jgi:PAS domain-containing protein